MKIDHIFFDLDRTLWDFEKNSKETLIELFEYFKLYKKGIKSSEEFINKYRFHNERLWSLYRQNSITKEELRTKRFYLVLEDYGIFDFQLAEDFGLSYVKNSPLKTSLLPFAVESLDYLFKKYTLHIITNGFEEVQYLKLENSNLLNYFKTIITSEKVGVKKPNPIIFDYALNNTGAKLEHSIIIGDDLEADIIGARDFGMKQIYFNPHNLDHQQYVTFEIDCLNKLKEIL